MLFGRRKQPKKHDSCLMSPSSPRSIPVDLPVSDSVRLVARSRRRPTLPPQLFPVPDPVRHRMRKRKAELMCEHTHLPAMVGFVSKHVAEHLQANRPGRSPSVSMKLLDAASTATERFSEHLLAASGALGQSLTSLLRRAMGAVELKWNLEVGSREPDPLAADVVHVGEDRRNGSDLAGFFGWRFSWQFGCPGGRVKMFDKNLIHTIIDRKHLD
jgi:hypothetical protein